ncbi:hypothetical protein [Streptomyces sp. Da 82-17]|uniref:hypothetical protein n=1 Tax=Streptomyces sp. Da 82-17 TaxID=3377116 RepID=UPI0038D449D8
MPDTAEPSTQRRPETEWEHCLVWGSLLIRVRVRELEQQQRLTEDQTLTLLGRDRDLVVVLIAGALHAHLQDAGLAANAAGQIPLGAPNDEGVTGTLRRAAYAALKASPTEDKGREERALLLRAATSDDPDERALWERLRAAALDTVAGVAALMPAIADVPRHPDATEAGRYWERAVVLGDVAATEQRRTAYEAAAAAFGEDY